MHGLGCSSSLDTDILRLSFMAVDAYRRLEGALKAHTSDINEVPDLIEEELRCNSNRIRPPLLATNYELSLRIISSRVYIGIQRHTESQISRA